MDSSLVFTKFKYTRGAVGIREPAQAGLLVQAVHCFYGVVSILHRNCTGHCGIVSHLHQAETRKGGSNTSVQLGIAKYIEDEFKYLICFSQREVLLKRAFVLR